MRARFYNKVIEFWQTATIPDGYGGFTVTDIFITKSWCSVKTASNNSRYVSRLTDLGITDPTSAIIINLRYRSDIDYNAINQFIKYRGDKYVIQTTPTNINFRNTEIELIAIRQSTDEVPIYVYNDIFDTTFDLTFG